MAEHETRVHHVPAGALSEATAQTSGMRRLAAISGATVGAQALWMGQSHVAPGANSGMHHHGESETGIFVLSGHPVFSYREDGNEVHVQTAPGDFVYVPPFVHHVEGEIEGFGDLDVEVPVKVLVGGEFGLGQVSIQHPVPL